VTVRNCVTDEGRGPSESIYTSGLQSAFRRLWAKAWLRRLGKNEKLVRSLELSDSVQRLKPINQRSLAKKLTTRIGTWTTEQITLCFVPSQFSN
jgi:hypothetical protein